VWRTELYNTCGTVMTLAEYIDLTDSFPGYRNFTPELKTPPAAVPMPFPSSKGNYTQAQLARDMVDTFLNKGISPYRVFPQSFLPDDVYLWIEEYPDTFGPQAVYLDEEADDPADFPAAVARLPELAAKGVNIIAPPINYLLTVTGENNETIVPSDYGYAAKAAGLDIIAWTMERSGPLTNVKATEDYYFSTFADGVKTDGQFFEILDMLAQEIGIVGAFSDWSSSVSYYGSCMGLKGTYGEKYHAAPYRQGPV
jgi:glycerophosphoryl diester phosphodiesterase